MKILFLDLDDVLILDKCEYLPKEDNTFYDTFMFPYQFDPFGLGFLNNLFDKNEDLYCVLHSTWRELDKDWLLEHFRHQKAEFRWHESFCTNPELSRWVSINEWLKNNPDITREQFAILDDAKPSLDLKTRTIRVNENTGIDNKNCQRLVQLLNLRWKK